MSIESWNVSSKVLDDFVGDSPHLGQFEFLVEDGGYEEVELVFIKFSNDSKLPACVLRRESSGLDLISDMTVFIRRVETLGALGR